jgi:hypothetical protein
VGEHQVRLPPGDNGPAAFGPGVYEHDAELLAELSRYPGRGGHWIAEAATDPVHNPVVVKLPAVLREFVGQQGGWVVLHGQQDRLFQLGASEDDGAALV